MSPKTYKKLTKGWSLAILFLTLSPGSDYNFIPHMDKVAHFAMFSIYSILAFLGWSNKKNPKKYVTILNGLIIGTGIVLAAATEMLQNYVPHRNADVFDWLADFLGLVSGLVTIQFVKNVGWSRN